MIKNKIQRRRSLENEVIMAVMILYLLIALVMVIVHYMQPSDRETATSSSSPIHSEQSIHKSESK
jgi:hypothetical protein